MNHKRITVLRGGPSTEYDVSLKTGANVISALRTRYAAVDDVVITRRGEWLLQGVVRSPEQILAATDVIFVALHGTYGEDGEVQRIIERHRIPFTGSGSLASAVAFNKHVTKETLRQHGIAMPAHRIVTIADLPNLHLVVQSIAAEFGPSYIVKPVADGSSVGISLALDSTVLQTILAQALEDNDMLLVEEYITGREATCAVLEQFRDQSTYVFPVIEIIPPADQPFFTTTAKYNGTTREICPGNFSYTERSKIAELAEFIHQSIGLSQYSRSDFILKNGTPYFLEVNTLPGLTNESLFPKAAAAVGLSFSDLVTHLVETATN